MWAILAGDKGIDEVRQRVTSCRHEIVGERPEADVIKDRIVENFLRLK
jgi:hypothetical protein